MIQAIDPDNCPEPERLDTVFQIATMSRWFNLYKLSALCSIGRLSNVNTVIQTTQLQIEHLQQEIALVSNTINALRGEGPYPCINGNQAMIRFFRTPRDTNTALRRYLTEEFEGNHTWFEALRAHTRKHLFNAVDTTKTFKTSEHNEELQLVLVTQLGFLERHLQERKHQLDEWHLPIKRSSMPSSG